MEVITMLAGACLSFIAQEIRWRRREKSEAKAARVRAYLDLLSRSELCYSALCEAAHLQRGLGWWNGRTRLELMRQTKLDQRLFTYSDELARALAAIRIHGSPEGVVSAKALLESISAPLLETDSDAEDMLERFTEARDRFVQVIRKEGGSGALPPTNQHPEQTVRAA